MACKRISITSLRCFLFFWLFFVGFFFFFHPCCYKSIVVFVVIVGTVYFGLPKPHEVLLREFRISTQ